MVDTFTLTEGKWEKLVRPIADDLELPGTMGLPVTLRADYARDVGKVIVMLAQLIDSQGAVDGARRRLVTAIWQAAALAMLVLFALAMVYG